MTTLKIAFQGEPGAFSEQACVTYAPDFAPLPCPTFELALAAVTEGRAERAMLPVENSLAGRVSDIHYLLPHSGLSIIGEHFLRVQLHLISARGAAARDLRVVRSHAVALNQCRRVIAELGLRPEASGDTAGAARLLAEQPEVGVAVIASRRAAEIYGLDILRADVEDEDHNTTRFLQMARRREDAPPDAEGVMTTFVFNVRNIPAALYKALGGFATNGVNMTKLESYQLGGAFVSTMFYADIEGHPEHPAVSRALEELQYFSTSLRILGVYRSARPRQP